MNSSQLNTFTNELNEPSKGAESLDEFNDKLFPVTERTEEIAREPEIMIHTEVREVKQNIPESDICGEDNIIVEKDDLELKDWEERKEPQKSHIPFNRGVGNQRISSQRVKLIMHRHHIPGPEELRIHENRPKPHSYYTRPPHTKVTVNTQNPNREPNGVAYRRPRNPFAFSQTSETQIHVTYSNRKDIHVKFLLRKLRRLERRNFQNYLQSSHGFSHFQKKTLALQKYQGILREYFLQQFYYQIKPQEELNALKFLGPPNRYEKHIKRLDKSTDFMQNFNAGGKRAVSKFFDVDFTRHLFLSRCDTIYREEEELNDNSKGLLDTLKWLKQLVREKELEKRELENARPFAHKPE